MITRKIYRNGNSIVVGLPRSWLNQNMLLPGSTIVMEHTRPGVLELKTLNINQEVKNNGRKSRQKELPL